MTLIRSEQFVLVRTLYFKAHFDYVRWAWRWGTGS